MAPTPYSISWKYFIRQDVTQNMTRIAKYFLNKSAQSILEEGRVAAL